MVEVVEVVVGVVESGDRGCRGGVIVSTVMVRIGSN